MRLGEVSAARGDISLLDFKMYLQAVLRSGAEIREALLPISPSELSSQSAEMTFWTFLRLQRPSCACVI